MQDAKEEVRARLNIEDVIGEYVQLKRAGRNFKGLSPFTGEKTASFYVSPDKNIWHDFSSNKGGDVFSFVMEVEGIDFREALDMLARRAGVDLTVYDTAGSRTIAKHKKRLSEALELATQYYHQSLVRNQHALEYVFKKRNLSKKIVETFRIGYSPDSGDALVQFLTRKGFSRKELADAGLTNRFDGDLFRGRMMVPLMDGAGQVVGFTGRILKDEPNAPKYLNTPQTLLYDKSRHVFGLSQAKEAIRTLDYAVVVEGNLDVVSSHQVGISQVVATAGTALTEHHLKALVRLSPVIRFAFDGDAAGLAATERAIPIAQSVGVDLSIITLPDDAKDPDELIQKDPDFWQQAIEHAEPVVDWVLTQYSKREDMTSAIGKRRFSTAALGIIQALGDPVVQEHYLQKTADYLHVSLDVLKNKLGDAEQTTKPLKKMNRIEPAPNDPKSHQDALLALALVTPKIRHLLGELDASLFDGDDRQAVFTFLKTSTGEVSDVPDPLKNSDTYVKILLLKADARYGDWTEEDHYLEAARLVRLTINEHKNIQKQLLTAELKDAEAQGDEAKVALMTRQLNELIKEMPRAKK